MAGAMGDVVAVEPVHRYLKREYPDYVLVRLVWNPYSQLIKFDPNVDLIVSVYKKRVELMYLLFFLKLVQSNKFKIINLYTYGEKFFRYKTYTFIDMFDKNIKEVRVDNHFLYGNLLQAFSFGAGLPKLNDKPKLYLPPSIKLSFNLPRKYILIHPLSSSPENQGKNWDNEKWNELVNYLVSKNHHVIEIGSISIIKNNSKKFANLCGKVSLLESAFIIKDCELFIGLDSGFAHFANALNVKKWIVLLGKYKNYKAKEYIPYSGLSKQELDEIIIRYDGDLFNMPLSVVMEKNLA
jgi:heptosyltransferase-3